MEWRLHARCRGTDLSLWFPEGRGATISPDAIEMCRHCPVVADCLDDALTAERGLAAQWRHGIRAGLTPQERAELDTVRARRPQRQRADTLR